MEWENRTYCAQLDQTKANVEVLMMGWVDAIRDHGNLLFIHLRDRSGIVQMVFNPEANPECFQMAEKLKVEDIVKIHGKVHIREEGKQNPYLKSGDIEVLVDQIERLSSSSVLPFQISEKAIVFGNEITSSPQYVDEEIRLKYRYLDIRRPSIFEIFQKRHEIVKCIRDFLDEQQFLEVETPILTKSTPEGARDYLVPSRIHPGNFYALPQSPQLFKQLLMIGGMERYFQIARCFRDEDLRPNRQPEFTQMDLEASFIDEEFIYEVIEEMVVRMFKIGGYTLPRPFERISFDETMDKYGCDRPDLRFDMAFTDVTSIFQNTKYAIFRQIINQGGYIKGFCIKGEADILSKNLLQNEYAKKIVPKYGGKGMTWMKVVGGILQSSIVQFFSTHELEQLRSVMKAEDGDVLILVADANLNLVNQVLCSLRLDFADRLELLDKNRFCPVWIYDFPVFEEKDAELTSVHHPFTLPKTTDFDPKNREKLISLKSRAYDLVINGEELGGGSIRIHQKDVQEKIFQVLGLNPEEIQAKFGFFLSALEYGAPPHGGIALGLDRVVSMILQQDSIREVIAFPKNRRAFCTVTASPSPVRLRQLEELGLHHSTGLGDFRELPSKIYVCDDKLSKLDEKHKISIQDVLHVGELAWLKLGHKEIQSYQKELNAILAYAETLKDLNTENVDPMSHVIEMKNVWREDHSEDSQQSEMILTNAPERDNNYFKVPKIMED